MSKRARGDEVTEKAVLTAPQSKSVVREYAEALIIAVLLALVIRTFVVQAFKIPSGSMLPTLQIGDHILVNKFLYYFRPVQRGDIIVFKFPQDETRDFIKRVIGLPGETWRFAARRCSSTASRWTSRTRSTGTGRWAAWASGRGWVRSSFRPIACS